MDEVRARIVKACARADRPEDSVRLVAVSKKIPLPLVIEALCVVVIAMSPITPHICHRLWQVLTGQALEDARWPEVDESALEKKHVEIVVQVNGKLRGKIEVDVGKTQEEVEDLARAIENVSRFMEDKTVRKVIYVPEKLLNFVAT